MRRAGILLHPTSLPGAGPSGDLGPGARAFLDWLEAAGCTLWQVLPLCPTGGAFSPYDSPCAMGLSTDLLSLEDLVADGLLSAAELGALPGGDERVDLGALSGWHAPRVALAARRLAAQDPAALQAFRLAQPWVQDWGLYLALTQAHDTRWGWWDLPAPLRDRDPRALAQALDRRASIVDSHIAAQLLVHRQWAALRALANQRGIQIVGDVPIFVSGGGVDTWANRSLFRWGPPLPDGRPAPDPVAGVPPDYFSPTGQRWGNPLYDWPAHAAQGYAWWCQRLRAAFLACDAVRIDHFRGFCAAWAVPADAPDATTGRWTPGPGRQLFDALEAELRATPPPGIDLSQGLPIVAEDLGLITPDVEALRDELGLPGMKILQFAFGGPRDHTFLPHTWTHDRWVAYSGTHDNDTIRGWYDTTDEAARDHFRRYVGRDGHEPHWQLFQPLLSSIARWVVLPMQDIFGLGSEHRMNRPGETDGNWLWRARDLPSGPAGRLRELVELYSRLPSPEPTAPQAL